MSDSRLAPVVARFRAEMHAAGMADALADALIDLLDVYVDRITLIVNRRPVHDLAAPAPAERIPPPGHDDPEDYV